MVACVNTHYLIPLDAILHKIINVYFLLISTLSSITFNPEIKLGDLPNIVYMHRSSLDTVYISMPTYLPARKKKNVEMYAQLTN